MPMKPKPNPENPSALFLIYSLFAGAALLALGVKAFFSIREAVAAGQIYSLGVRVGSMKVAYEGDQPWAFWICISVFSLCGIVAFSVGLWGTIMTIERIRHKLAHQNEDE
jgi:hypothetical protein